jgi:hypothetical protein
MESHSVHGAAATRQLKARRRGTCELAKMDKVD